MESKPKKRQVRKARSATREPAKSQAPKLDKIEPQPQEVLIRQNGDLVEELYKSKVWNEIVLPLIQESIASVSGRMTNGRYFHGTLTRDWSANTSIMLVGYQKALMDLNNNLNDFVVARDNLLESKQKEKEERAAPVYNPFMEEYGEEV